MGYDRATLDAMENAPRHSAHRLRPRHGGGDFGNRARRPHVLRARLAGGGKGMNPVLSSNTNTTDLANPKDCDRPAALVGCERGEACNHRWDVESETTEFRLEAIVGTCCMCHIAPTPATAPSADRFGKHTRRTRDGVAEHTVGNCDRCQQGLATFDPRRGRGLDSNAAYAVPPLRRICGQIADVPFAPALPAAQAP